MVAIQLLNVQHRREGFDCGDAALNEFLLRQAGQQQRRGFGKTLCGGCRGWRDSHRVCDCERRSGCHVSAACAVEAAALSRTHVENWPIGGGCAPSGKGIGQDLLAFALRLAVEFSQRVGLYAMVVDAKHDKAKAFYVRLGFIACLDKPLCLYLPIATLEHSIAP